MNIKELLIELNIFYDDFVIEAQKVRKEAPFVGKRRSTKEIYTSNMMHDISGEIAYLDIPYIDRIELIFKVYEVAPSYSVLTYLTMIYDKLEESDKSDVMTRYASYLYSDDEYLSVPIGYSLWCDYFEDPARVDYSYIQILSYMNMDFSSIQKLIDISGPVPYEYKKQLYQKLIVDESYHSLIYDSLRYSLSDYFGKVDKEDALILLKRLKIDRMTETYIEVVKRLDNI